MKNKPTVRQQINQLKKQKAAFDAHLLTLSRQAEAPAAEAEKRRVKQDEALRAQTVRLQQEHMGARAKLRRKS